MKRRNFIGLVGLGGVALTAFPGFVFRERRLNSILSKAEADLVIAGGGLGGCAAALAALRNGQTVIMTEETDWIGGQLTSQGVPPDEHRWIETHGAPPSYRDFRTAVRQYYRDHYPLTATARQDQYLNPGSGGVSRLCHEPKVALQVLQQMLAPYQSNGKLLLLTRYRAQSAKVNGDQVTTLVVTNLDNNHQIELSGDYFVDATELGDLLPLTGTEYITGTESKAQTGEFHAPAEADPANHQAFTMCFAMDYAPGENHLIEPPADYNFWRNYEPEMQPPWPGRLLEMNYSNPQTLEPRQLGFEPNGAALEGVLNLWNYRKILNRHNFEPGFYQGDMTLVNWPQNDYFPGNLIDVPEAEFNRHIEASKQLSLSMFYWLQTEVPRPDGGKGWPGLRLRGDVMGTTDGMAKYPYIRESRRVKALFTVLEEHVGAEQRASITGKSGDELKAADFYDSVGIGYYHIDLHPSSNGDNYIDFRSLPFQIPLGALLPVSMKNLLPANKNIGTTHITNGCYRLHPVEWSIGEAVGLLASFARDKDLLPRQVRENRTYLAEFQRFIRKQGLETEWPELT